MSHRLKYLEQSPEIYKSFFGFATVLAKESAIEESIRNLIDIRVSQLNGCAFCLDMHVKQAKMRGERELRVHHISIWRESPIFSDACMTRPSGPIIWW